MKKDSKSGKTAKENPRKTWGGVTNTHWEYLKEDGEMYRSEISIWRERQARLVEMAKETLAGKLDSTRLRADANDTEETQYRISDQLLADYYNTRFPERKISADALQRTRDTRKRFVKESSAEARSNDGAHSLHFDEACNLALIADVAFVPVGEEDVRSAIKTQDLTALLGIILDMVQSVCDDTRDVVNAEGMEIERTKVLHILFCYIDEYARKLAHAEPDEMTDEDVYERKEHLQNLAIELESAGAYCSFMVGPQRSLCMSMLTSMQTTVGGLIERTMLEAVVRGIPANGNRQGEEAAFRKIEELLKSYCHNAARTSDADAESEDEDSDEEDDDEDDENDEDGTERYINDYTELDEDAAMDLLREELEADRHRKHEE